MSLIDLHCHILPGVDDGAADLSTALELAKVAVDQGIGHILLTPHHMDRQYLNHKQELLNKVARFQTCIDEAQIPLTIFCGQEVHINGELIHAIETDDVLFMDEANRYLLLELPHSDIPTYASNLIFELVSRQIIPVIAHPERNVIIQKNPEKLYELVSQGCLTQITAGSYLGIFGQEVERLTGKIIQANLGTVFSSDAHNFQGRRFLMKDAFDKLNQEYPEKTEVFKQNAKDIINGENVEPVNFKQIKEMTKKKFWLF
ncbi:tyrosine-protein phosphatase [Companilactobacillus mishanensis]|uniref:tyrosine-protein phosphatase n=1 Tax=Companilactobacillus mishanensis TaxID=2486008 RepID=UPI001295E4FF|nr:CpsB/CapC family capsule biosynthesis tyrosine phosphatase [Companilactobacillus mishanensis]MQS88865.1 tyrosine protein phosphatase [Companilactobacillus mishanensis]